MPEKLSNAQIYAFWRHGWCVCGAKKYERQSFCADCFDDLSQEAKDRLKLKRGRGFEDAFRAAWAERNGETNE